MQNIKLCLFWISIDRFFHWRRFAKKAMPIITSDIEPWAMTVGGRNLSLGEWVAKDVNKCVLDEADSECNFRTGEIRDLMIVRKLYFFWFFMPVSFHPKY